MTKDLRKAIMDRSRLRNKFNRNEKPKTLAEFSRRCKAIKEKFKYDHFSFKPFTENQVINVILKLPTNKVSMSNDNPITILKQPVNVYYPKLTEIMNKCFKREMFPDNLKNAQTTPCHKNDRENKKLLTSPYTRIFSGYLKN